MAEADEALEPSYVPHGETARKTMQPLLKKVHVSLLCDSAIPVRSVYPGETKAYFYADFFTQTFIEALFGTAPNWKQPDILKQANR